MNANTASISSNPSRPTSGLGSFPWLNGAQFFGALNDNLFKFFCIFTLVAMMGADADKQVNAIAGIIFALPFLLLSELGGVLADRYDKRRVVIWVKIAEILVMVFGCLALWSRIPALIYGTLFLMSAQSAIFGPTKYGVIPELVARDQLSRANGYIQMFTFLAIIFGTVLAPALGEMSARQYHWVAPVCLLFAALGLVAARGIAPCSPGGSTRRANPLFFVGIFKTLARIRTDKYLFVSVLAASFFSFVGAYIQINVMPYGREQLGLSSERSAYLFLVAALGIGLGSVTAGRLSGRNIEFGVVPLGALGMTISTLFLGLGLSSALTTAIWMGVLGFSAGLYIVPLSSFIQSRCSDSERGGVIAADNFLSWVGVLTAAGLALFNADVLGISAAQGFLMLCITLLCLTVVTLWVLPDFLLRFVALITTRILYRLRVINPQHVPVDGPALLVCNHVSWIDAYVLLATQQRRIRFIMDRGMFHRWKWLTPIFRLLRVIPISTQDPPREIVASLQEARKALDEGWLVCIFAEGQLTRSGFLLGFKGGLERIVKGSSHPVIPVYLGGAWGSIFSYAEGHAPATRLPARLPYPLTILFGQPLPPSTPSWKLRQAVADLSVDYFNDLKPRRIPLGLHFVRSARRYSKRRCMVDSSGKEFTFRKVLISSLALRRALQSHLGEARHVGVWLPTGIGGALANIALALDRRVSVNLNFTASQSSLASAVKQAELDVVITARAFEEKAGPPPEGIAKRIYLEDLLGTLSTVERLRAFVEAWLAPAKALVDPENFSADDVFTIIFSSGSTSTPKGVMLSHHNVHSNIESFRMVIEPTEADNICAPLPFFHSFGFTCGLWFPIISGFSAAYHPNPLDAGIIGDLARTHRSTILVATPSFLLSYLRRVKPEDFKTLRFLVVGAEKLKPALARRFHERFGIMPLEGYGTTECAPVISCNSPDLEVDGVQQIGSKEGTVGRPLPGISVQMFDPSTGEEVPPGEVGECRVKGPNVMLGYLGRPDLTAEVIVDGRYRTGDLCRMDEEGFITIVDRLSRFSKIAGEMVPHHAVEEELQRLAGRDEPVFAVTSFPDEKKGEKLAVIYVRDHVDLPTVLNGLRASESIPNLWKPAANTFVPVDEIPLLGSGKMDLKNIKALAEQGLTKLPTPVEES